jgi:hypothetical protein
VWSTVCICLCAQLRGNNLQSTMFEDIALYTKDHKSSQVSSRSSTTRHVGNPGLKCALAPRRRHKMRGMRGMRGTSFVNFPHRAIQPLEYPCAAWCTAPRISPRDGLLWNKDIYISTGSSIIMTISSRAFSMPFDMSKETFTHHELASAQIMTPFVENPELEKRYYMYSAR